ncbi:MAG TPA: hypothetical protein VGI82_11825 [Chitinophagaceae bacterium]
MKFAAFFCLLFFAIILCLCSKHKDNSSQQLPPVTETGKNIFGCNIDGSVWLPHFSCGGLSTDPCGEIFTNISHAVPGKPAISIEISASVKYPDNSVSYFLFTSPNGTGIQTIGEKIDSVSFEYFKPGSIQYVRNPQNVNDHFFISKLDTINKIISGTFGATLYRSPTDSVKVTDGRFDLVFSACKCSN